MWCLIILDDCCDKEMSDNGNIICKLEHVIKEKEKQHQDNVSNISSVSIFLHKFCEYVNCFSNFIPLIEMVFLHRVVFSISQVLQNHSYKQRLSYYF